jgi:hypothetical protein
MGHSKSTVYRILYLWLGESPSDTPHVLHECDASSGGVFPLGCVQLRLP